MYYVWGNDWTFPDAEEVNVPEAWNRYSLYSGERIAAELPPIQFLLNAQVELSDSLVNRWGYLAFSPKLREVVERSTDDPVQYLDAIIRNKATGEEVTDYKVANLLAQIEALDLERSSVEYFEDEYILSINSLVLDQGSVGEHTLFRLREYPPIAIVSKGLVDAVKQSNCTGMDFISVEEFRA